MSDHFFVSCIDGPKTALILGPFTNEADCRQYAYSEPEERGHPDKNRAMIEAVYKIDPKSWFYSFGMLKIKEIKPGESFRGLLNKLNPEAWDGVLS